MTDIYGILGFPVGHSRSPAMHNSAFNALGIDAMYVPFAVPPERLPAAISSIRPLNLRGMNVTLPHLPGGDPAQFWWVLGIMVALAAGMLAVFRSRERPKPGTEPLRSVTVSP